jgi:hypothetical protein
MLDWYLKNPAKYDWTGTATTDEIKAAVVGTQNDLDTVAGCASNAIDNPGGAKRPAGYATDHGIAYPAGVVPTVLPKPLPGKAIVWDAPSYTGRSQSLPAGRYDDANRALTVGNDAIQSVTVPAGLIVRLYEHFHFQGAVLDLTESTEDLNNWDKKTSSLIVHPATDPVPVITEVVLVQLPGLDTWDGPFWVVDATTGRQADPTMGIRSAHVPPGMVLSLFDAPNFGGARVDVTADTGDLGVRDPHAYSFVVWAAADGFPAL